MKTYISEPQTNSQKGRKTTFFGGQSKPSFFSPVIQPKLTIGSPNDVYEQEADAMADQVMPMQQPDIQLKPVSVRSLQRKCAHCEEEEKRLHKKGTSDMAGEAAPKIVDGVINSGGGTSLDSSTRDFMENRFNYNFSNVRVHTNSQAAESAKAIRAKAYTTGNQIVFNTGEYAPHTHVGKHLLAHELTHVVQQGGVQRKIQRKLCNYEKDEIEKSHSSLGLLTNDVTALGNGELLISDFGVDWRHTNLNILKNPVFQQWDRIFSNDDTYELQIVGYSDCAGDERNNIQLRQSRAKNVKKILSKDAQKRVTFTGMAGLGEYVTNNDSPINRAINRGVIIRFSKKIEFEPEIIETTIHYCGPDSTQWLVDEMYTNANDPFIKKCGSAGYEEYIPGWGWGITAACLKGFKELVQGGAEWDFKNNQKQWRNSDLKVCPSKECDKTVTLCGHCFFYDVPGNIHYGYVGRMAGFTPLALHLGGDYAQKGGKDDPMDVVALDIGINMAENGVSLCDEINKKLTGLNRSGTTACNPCQWGNWNRKNRKQSRD